MCVRVMICFLAYAVVFTFLCNGHVIPVTPDREDDSQGEFRHFNNTQQLEYYNGCYGIRRPTGEFICIRPLGSNPDAQFPTTSYVPHSSQDYYDGNYNGRPLSPFAVRLLRSYRYTGECGKRFAYADFNDRISTGYIPGGGIAKFGEYPWHAAVLTKFGSSYFNERQLYKYLCGGTLISPIYTITAAHCIKGIEKTALKIKLGDLDLEADTEPFPSIDRNVEKVYLHNRYSPSTYVNDVAILEINRPVDLSKTPHINTVCLPPRDIKLDSQTKCYIAGWGVDVFKPSYGSSLLKGIGVTQMDKKDCMNKLTDQISSLTVDFKLHESQECFAGGYGRGACKGDGGGAVVCPVPDSKLKFCRGRECVGETFVIAGIISWGSPNCGAEDAVTVITSLDGIHDWVIGNTRLTYDEQLNDYYNHEHPYGYYDRFN